MRQRLIVVGAGGLGREVVEAARACNAVEETWEILGYLDDNAIAGSVVDGVTVLGPIDALRDYDDALVVACVGAPGRNWTRKRVVMRIDLPAERFATIVHPTAVVPAGTTVGAGSMLLAGVILTTPIEIGRHVAVMPATVFTHDDVVGDHATFASGVRLAGEVSIGEGAYLGAGALVRERVSVGAWSVVGMGSVVLGDVPSEQVWAGSPARFLRGADVPSDLHG